MNLSDKARDLILEHESIAEVPEWPGGESGVTIGIGYDIGFNDLVTFRRDWQAELAPDVFKRLATAIDVKGKAAKRIAGRFRDIRISRESAVRVFDTLSVPRYTALARKAFQGFDALPADARGALVSLVFNRGAGMGVKGKPSWESRREMRAIRTVIGIAPADMDGALRVIAEEIRSMKRIWEGKGLGGLIRRREDEAKLVESAIGERS